MAPRLQRRNIYRRRAQGIRPAQRAFAGLATIVVIGLVVYLAYQSQNGIPFKSYSYVNVSVPNIGHLQAHQPVEIGGVYVGQVESIGTADNRPLAKLQLSGVGRLPSDTHAVVRTYGLLGARYVELDPGTSHAYLPNDGRITELNQHSSFTWGVPEFLNLLDPKTRDALGYMWRGFGTGLEGRGTQLNEAIGVGPDSGADFDQAAYAILARPGAAQAFFPDQNAGWTALNAAGTPLIQMFSPAANVAQAFVDERAPTDDFIQGFPAAERNIDAGFSSTVGLPFWGSVSHLADTLKPVLPQVPHALDAAVHFLRSTQTPLRQTIPALNQVPRAVGPALHILAALRPNLNPLTQAFTKLVAPVSNLSEHGCDIQNFATATQGLVGLGSVPGGHWGPDGAFPISLLVNPSGYLNSYVNTHNSPFINQSGYYAPCTFAPGPVINSSTFNGITSGLLGGAL